MNILFLFQRFSFKSSTIYLDLVDECVRRGHEVYVLAGTSDDVDTKRLHEEHGSHVAYVRLPDQFHSGKIKKGFVQLMIEPLFLNTLRRLLWDLKIDLMAYPTPPITLAGVVKKAGEHYGCIKYLMLKDIFPQNAADLGMMGKNSPVFRYFRRMEKRLYDVSDVIGCMSQANVEYIRRRESGCAHKLELFPNTVRILPDEEIPEKRTGDPDILHLMLGGNLGRPQAVDFLLDGMKKLHETGFDRVRLTIAGDGTEAARIRGRIESESLSYVNYVSELPRDEYEALLSSCDAGIISLSADFTIPNFPSRLLSYMQIAKPVLVVTDRCTDMGSIVEKEARCGFFTPSGDIEGFVNTLGLMYEKREELAEMGRRGREYLKENYAVSRSVDILEQKLLSFGKEM